MDLGASTEISVADVVQAMQKRQVGELATSEKAKVQHYVSCIRGEVSLDNYLPADYLAVVADRPRRLRMAQLRTGSHWLAVETGRWQRLDREQRVCPHCDAAAIEDEAHMIFDCPLYAGLRLQYTALFSSGDRNLGSFLSQDSVQVAQFVHRCHSLTA